MHPRRTVRAALPVAGLALSLTAALAPAQALQPSPGSPNSGDSILPTMGNGGYDARDYAIDLAWKPKDRRIVATTRIRSVAKKSLSSFNLELTGLRVREVRVDGRPAAHRRDGRELTVIPLRAIRKGDTFRTTISYAGRPRTLDDPKLGKSGWIMTGDGATALSEPIGSETWFPVNNTLRDKATYSIAVDVPRSVKAASNGRLVGRDVRRTRTTWRWRENRLMSPYLVTVSIGRYRMFRSQTSDGLPLVTFVDSELGRQRSARRSLPRVIDFLERRFGRYPFASSGMIIDRLRVGYALETQSRPVFPGSAPDYLIVHELAHQWFGNSVTPDDWRHIWLNEGFATYAEWLWDAREQNDPGVPQENFDFYYEIYGPESRFWKVPPGDPGSVGKLFARPIYDRGAMALHALRMRVGTPDFNRILRLWARRQAYGTASVGDFKRLAEQVSGRQLDGLFKAWLYTPEKPRGY